MARLPYQVLVLPFFVRSDGGTEYAILRRSDHGYWQGIAGGGEDQETPIEAARRESTEEAGILPASEYFILEALDYVERRHFKAAWPPHVAVIPSHSFAVRLMDKELRLSGEHLEYQWTDFERAYALLHWQGNKTALWELNYRIERGILQRVV